MKLQNLSIIFIIIIIPVILITSYYIQLHMDTVSLQIEYTTKQTNATKEAIEAFEINTVEWNSKYSSLSDSLRRDVLASINTFTTSLANNMGIGGTRKEFMLNYIPAVLYTVYDGYYIYAPTKVPVLQKDSDGVTVMEEISENGVTTYKPYYQAVEGKGKNEKVKETEYVNVTTDIKKAKTTYEHTLRPISSYSEILKNGTVINYSLDNYVTVYTEQEVRSGHLIVTDNFKYEDNNLTIDDNIIEAEQLKENVYVNGKGIEELIYVYDEHNNKIYYYENENSFCYLDDYGNLTPLKNLTTKYYKKVCKPNGNDYTIERINLADSIDTNDYSAMNYYVEGYYFTNWFNENISNLDKIGKENDPEDINSFFNNHRLEVIKNAIQNDLNKVITAYKKDTGTNYKVPELSYTDIKQMVSNVSITTFMQEIPIGNKYYKNYVIATSNENNLYVSKDDIYYISKEDEDEAYHRYGCEELKGDVIVGYRSTDFVEKTYDKETKYYYLHEKQKEESIINTEQCYNCIINRLSETDVNYKNNNYKVAELAALARERYASKTMINNVDKTMTHKDYIASVPEDELANDDYYPDQMKPFITEWIVESGDTIVLPIYGYADIQIDWGDGTVEKIKKTVGINNINDSIKHTYNGYESEECKIIIKNNSTNSLNFEFFIENQTSVRNQSADKLKKVTQWGAIGFNCVRLYGCVNLESISEPYKNTFKNQDSMQYMFRGCKNLKTIPKGLFSNCPNVTTMHGAFFGCENLTKIPDRLFEGCINVTRFEGVFSGCTKLTSIPDNIFINCTSANSFGEAFSKCTGITSIPENLFYYTPNVTDMHNVFNGCTGLESIPENLFKNCKEIDRVYGMFNGCNKIESIPKNLLLKCEKLRSEGIYENIYDICIAFMGCDLEGDIDLNVGTEKLDGKKVEVRGNGKKAKIILHYKE